MALFTCTATELRRTPDSIATPSSVKANGEYLGYFPCLLYTSPDKPAGRGQKLHRSDVKLAALELGLPVLQPEKLKAPEFVAAVSYTHLIPSRLPPPFNEKELYKPENLQTPQKLSLIHI